MLLGPTWWLPYLTACVWTCRGPPVPSSHRTPPGLCRIATPSAEAQRLFDQGLLLAYNYQQEDAREAFLAALSYDPGCAMCLWGLAYAYGERGGGGGGHTATNKLP